VRRGDFRGGADTTSEIRFTSVRFQRKQKRSDYGSEVRGIRFRNRLIDDRRDRIEIAAEMLLSPCFQIRFEGDSFAWFLSERFVPELGGGVEGMRDFWYN
jgi:hypothetical protein